MGLKFNEETSEVLRLEHSCVCCTETWTVRKVNQDYLESFGSVLLEKDGEDQLDRSYKERRSIAKNHGGVEYAIHTINGRKANWIGHILRGNCLLNHVTEERIEGGTEVTRKNT